LPNESRLSGGQTRLPGAQLLPYLILDCPALQSRLARRCRRWLGSASRRHRGLPPEPVVREPGECHNGNVHDD